VLFEDFASDALLFSVYYWLDVGSGTPARQVASDLRAMIEAALTEHGIAIPYPQRDVHIDAATPLPVRIVQDEGSPAAPAPAVPPLP
jgi:small-conductance mechanosensitive channel